MSRVMKGLTIEQGARVRDQVTAFVMPDKAELTVDLGLEVIDVDGDPVAEISPVMVRVLHSLGKLDREKVIRDLVTVPADARKRGYEEGKRVGHHRAVAMAHELLGIDRLVRAIESVGPV